MNTLINLKDSTVKTSGIIAVTPGNSGNYIITYMNGTFIEISSDDYKILREHFEKN